MILIKSKIYFRVAAKYFDFLLSVGYVVKYCLNITLSLRDSLEDGFIFFTSFCITQGRKLRTWFVSQQKENILPLNPQIFCQRIEKKN